MAIRRPPPHNHNHKRMDAVRIDRQDLRDIYAILDRLPDRFDQTDAQVRLKVNDYDADTLDDIFDFDRPVEDLMLSSRDLSVMVNLRSDTGCLLIWDKIPDADQAVEQIESILEPRYVSGQIRKFVGKFFLMTLVITLAVGLTIVQLLRRNGVGDEAAINIAVAAEFAVLAPAMYWGTRTLSRSKAKPVSIFMADHTDEPWWKAHYNELILVLTAIAATGTVLALIL